MNARKFFSRVGVAYFLMIVLLLAVQIALNLLLALFAPGLLYRFPSLYWVFSYLPLYLVAMPVCFLTLRRLPAMQIHRVPLGGQNYFHLLCIALFITEAGNLIGNFVCMLINRLTPLDLTSALVDMMETGNLGVAFLFTVILAPILEELIFRKALIDRAIVFGDRTAILLSGLIFGLLHGNLYQFFYAFGLGCLFAYVYIRTGRIRYTISFHMIINFVGGFIGTLLLRQIENFQYFAGRYGSIYPLFGRLGAIAGLAVVELLVIALAITGLIFFLLSFRKATLLPGEYSMSGQATRRAVLGNAGMILFLISAAFLFVTSMV